MGLDGAGQGQAARIHEQGYRRYEGDRLGSRNAVRAVFLHTLRFILGFKRRFRAKVIPAGILALAILPAVGFSAMLMILPNFATAMAQEILPGPEAFLGGTIFLVFIASAIAGPAALCGDRLHGSLAIYLASPLTRRTYLLGKGLAVFAFMLTVTLLPSLLYVLGVALSGVQTQSAVSIGTDVLQVVVAGTLAALAYSALSMAAAALTDRQGAAAGMVVGFSMVSTIISGVLVEGLGMPEAVGLLNLNYAVVNAVLHLHVQGGESFLGMTASLLGSLGWIAALTGLVVLRYDRLQVTR